MIYFTPDQAFHFIWGISVGICFGVAIATLWQARKMGRK